MTFLTAFLERLLTLLPRVIIVDPDENAILFRLGRARRVVGQGCYFLLPLIDSYRSVPTSEQIANIGRQTVEYKKVQITFEGTLQFKVRNPKKALLTVQDYQQAITEYAGAVLCGSVLENGVHHAGWMDSARQQITQKGTQWGLAVQGLWLAELSTCRAYRILMDTERGESESE
jgi:hypothetical protein